ncbi:hypothetical protein ADH76_10135 [Enterocloster clostridioformis]|uniref:HD domain-containing protein n=1 Tax=Enterocloster clostridioformis TaxID=1531 RepID=UPI00080C8BD7|nr:HD domain-containing protein [Enterocloster clostridioformis]ANU48490.1 hypothetical protein A4V08_24465 [Lachnoclostridium sp. YL32]WAK79590.1 metal-dependent phosphohydrolase [Clostridium phage Saumur]NDO29249.1 HD domain-containing protein [Enterocloster clostridioformis]OXE68808.1 hypothetical protein ADH76_10135 [Enterocloster clostridioformis]QQR02624.1 HD domain-containing protein [Enterocloster clostridioformis]
MTHEEIKTRFRNAFTTYVHRDGAAELLDFLESNGFYEAPASTKHHGAFPGGLAAHSVNVFERLAWIAAEEAKKTETFDVEQLAVVSLLHDICKMDAYKLADKWEIDENGKWQQIQRYTYTKKFPIGHGEKSVILILRFMELTEEEMLAIRWHMGPYDFYAKGGGYDLNNAFKQCKLAVMLHLADMMATHFDEK